MRLLTYNVRSLRDDRGAAASVIRTAAPDVVCLQEAPRFARWRSKRAALARESGLLSLGAVRPAGLGFLHTLAVRPVSVDVVLLSKQRGRHQRGVAVAVVEVDGVHWTVAGVHLSLDPDERLRHLDEVFVVLDRYAGPLVLAGDLNDVPGSPVWNTLAARLADAGGGPTYPSHGPQRRIDAVFVGPRVEVVSCEAVHLPGVERASDHLPVLAELRPPTTRPPQVDQR